MSKRKEQSFHERLHDLIDKYVHKVYDSSQNFPDEERYGACSQLRRSTLSIMLNYKEGYGRQGSKELKHFLKISFGSLKESKYLVDFAHKRGWISNKQQNQLDDLSEEIARMMWGTIQKIG